MVSSHGSSHICVRSTDNGYIELLSVQYEVRSIGVDISHNSHRLYDFNSKPRGLVIGFRKRAKDIYHKKDAKKKTTDAKLQSTEYL